MGLHQPEKLLHSQGNHEHDEKVTYGMGKDICKPHISDKGLISKIYKLIQQQEIQITQLKNGQWTQMDIFLKKIHI